ncbi:hypothetical protein LINPERHAP1_LOCUS17443 [Linum perenne]
MSSFFGRTGLLNYVAVNLHVFFLWSKSASFSVWSVITPTNSLRQQELGLTHQFSYSTVYKYTHNQKL